MQVRQLAELFLYSFIYESKEKDGSRWVTWHLSGEPIVVSECGWKLLWKPREGWGWRDLLRHNDSEWIQGFYGSIDFADSLQAELVALLQGLISLAWACGARQLMCYLDSAVALSLFFVTGTTLGMLCHHYRKHLGASLSALEPAFGTLPTRGERVCRCSGSDGGFAVRGPGGARSASNGARESTVGRRHAHSVFASGGSRRSARALG